MDKKNKAAQRKRDAEIIFAAFPELSHLCIDAAMRKLALQMAKNKLSENCPKYNQEYEKSIEILIKKNQSLHEILRLFMQKNEN